MPAADSPAARASGKPDNHAGAPDWAARADQAARSVTRAFGQRLFFLPGTHIGAIARPPTRLGNLFRPWHYWWQAHYVDCLVDAGGRELASGAKFDGAGRPSAGRLASRLVTTIRLRNFLRFVNSYYDDMAWLALATLRLEELAEASRRPGRRRNAYVRRKLTLQFDSASTDELGGGTFWSTKRDFKNTPATAPVALYFARTGRPERAQALLDWMDARLFDPARGLYMDGVRISGGEAVLEDSVYTYNQGPVLGALLELGGEANLARAAAVVDAIATELTLPEAAPGRTAQGAAPGRLVIRGEGSGDGGLFTGILLRYVALAARDGRLPGGTRFTARSLVAGTAEAFWAGRTERDDGTLVFSPEPQRPAGEAYPAGAAVELSTQLQAWMALEAAASLN
ncbi:glycoside hydrolase family 76 protein [Arthrobacter sp. CJ23]|uniref:glycoside hydrolase family 76 protein n=1 Tax=Arthrobacter sp. CJ23 TaxID=2972479 RepID=UPI00215CD27F|nr:glycoside hydrolase family 76 protein [Arthrobacter sp. CJ23]UVJ40201.1 glycosyl hydrolase [Arthrobacter sp. CJ23]